jgi:hypothetical protein
MLLEWVTMDQEIGQLSVALAAPQVLRVLVLALALALALAVAPLPLCCC